MAMPLAPTVTATILYGYDGLRRLSSATYGPAINPDSAITYTYDPVGNRLKKKTATDSTLYQYNARNNHLLQAGSFQYGYDKNGNQTSKQGPSNQEWLFWYDFENRDTMLVRDHTNDTLRFWYDGAGRRFRKSSGTDTLVYAYDGIYQTCELDAQGNVKAIYVYTNGLLLAKIEVPPAGAIRKYFCHHDGLGSIIGMTDTQGNVVQSYLYDEFGRLLQEGSAMGPHNNYRYTAQEYDGPISELYNYRARYYDPETGRFTQEDPALVAGPDGLAGFEFPHSLARLTGNTDRPLVLNAYPYVLNNPTNLIDPTGENVQFCWRVPKRFHSYLKFDECSKVDPEGTWGFKEQDEYFWEKFLLIWVPAEVVRAGGGTCRTVLKGESADRCIWGYIKLTQKLARLEILQYHLLWFNCYHWATLGIYICH